MCVERVIGEGVEGYIEGVERVFQSMIHARSQTTSVVLNNAHGPV